MIRIKKTPEVLWLFGILFVSLGVAICSKADLGVSMIAAPAFVVQEALAPLGSFFSVGAVEYLIQALLLLVMCLAVRRFNWRYLPAFFVAVIYGYVLDLILFLMRDLSFDSAAVRWGMLLLGDLITSFGVACFFHTYLPLQVHELFVAEIARCRKKNIHKVKWIFDLSLLALSLLLAFTLFGDAGEFDWSKIGYTSFHNIGLGTIVTTFINSPIIAFFSKGIEKICDPAPLFPRFEKIMKRAQ